MYIQTSFKQRKELEIVSINKMDRVWVSEVTMAFPRKFIIFLNTDWAKDGSGKMMGDFYDVKDTREEALELKNSLGDSMGKVSIAEGFDDSPQIGGFSYDFG